MEAKEVYPVSLVTLVNPLSRKSDVSLSSRSYSEEAGADEARERARYRISSRNRGGRPGFLEKRSRDFMPTAGAFGD